MIIHISLFRVEGDFLKLLMWALIEPPITYIQASLNLFAFLLCKSKFCDWVKLQLESLWGFFFLLLCSAGETG